MKRLAITAVAALVLGWTAPAGAAEDVSLAPARTWSFSGMFGTFDRPQLRRGFQVYREVCASCHSLKRVAFRNLTALGFTPDQVNTIAAEFEVEDGPDDAGDMFMRPAKAADYLPPPFANDQAARAANGGALPPDLSLITKARGGESLFKGTKLREYGTDYVAALLTGYREEPPEHVVMAEGMHYNAYFPGHQIAMVPPLSDGSVTYEDGTPATLEQHAKDVAAFLTWAADPNAEERKALGVKAVLFLFGLCLLLYAVKRKVWSQIHH